MKSCSTVDFYRGWIVEIEPQTEGVRTICYSPSRQRLTDYIVYPTVFPAIAAAKRLIDKQFACHALKGFLRELYEARELPFEDWRQLNSSLSRSVKVI